MEEIENQKPKTRRTKKVPAKQIKSAGKSALLEWEANGKLCRGYVPITEYDSKTGKASEAILKAAIPYGVDWSKCDVSIDMDALDQELKRRGFWTADDVRNNPHMANIIIMRAAGLSRDALKETK